MTAGTRWRSPLLGSPGRADVAGGTLDYFDRGAGPCLLFAHGWLSNANLWRRVVAQLSADFRCVTLDLPLGSHRTAMRRDAALDPVAVAGLIADVLDRLDLRGVTLVGNDSGGAYAQIALARHARRTGPRVSRLVLTSCETPEDEWPPPPFTALSTVAQDPDQLGQLLHALRDPEIRMSTAAYGLLLSGPVEAPVFDSYALPASTDPAILYDVAKAMSGATTSVVRDVGSVLIGRSDLPVLLVWPDRDPVFPVAHARRYAEALVDARLEEVHGSWSFTPEEHPDALAAAIRTFALT